MLNEFVEKILVHERARKGSQDTTQEVEIYFNFVGKYMPPHFGEVTLTPEELRKREERKDKLHQNYLRRKASGAQKAWEKRYNAKRKAQIEAAKAAIREGRYIQRRVYSGWAAAATGAAESTSAGPCSRIRREVNV